MPNYVFRKIGEALNSIGKSIKGSKILVLGLSYKKNVDDLRESPSLEIIDNLYNNGAKLQYCDPYFNSIPPTRKYRLSLKGQKLTKKNIKSADLVLLATDHDDFNYKLIEEEAKLIVDTRGRFNKKSNIIKA